MRHSLSCALIVALFALSAPAADVITAASNASPQHWQPGDVNTFVVIAHGTTRSYEAVQDGAYIFGNEVAANGQPDMTTRRFLGTAHLLGVGAIGDDFFVASDTADHLDVRIVRISDGKEAHIAAEHEFATFTGNGTRLLITTWASPSGRGILIDRDLNLVVPPFLILLNETGTPAATPLAGQFFIVAQDFIVVQGTPPTYKIFLVDDTGKLQTVNRGLPTGSYIGAGSELLFFFDGGAFGRTAYMQRYSPTLNAIGDLITIAQSDTTGIGSPAAVPFGNDLFGSWLEGSDFYVQRLGAGDKMHLASGTKTSGDAVELGPGTVLARWRDAGGNHLVRRVDVDDAPHPDYYNPAEEREPSVASDGIMSMVAWAENDVRVARLAPDGSALDGDGIVISQSPVHPSGPVQILFDGSRYIVFWISEQTLVARYVERDGAPAGDIFRVSPQGSTIYGFNVAWSGAQYVLSWSVTQEPTFGTPAVLAVMAPGGVPAVPVGSYQNLAGVGGSRPIVFGDRGFGHLSATFFDTGDIVDVVTLPLGDRAWGYHVASSGQDYVVTWVQSHFVGNGRYDNTLWAAHLDDHGHVFGPLLPITTLNTAQPNPFSLSNELDAFGAAVPLFDGTNYRVVYAGPTFSEAILNLNAFICGCFEHTDVAFDTTVMKKLSAAVGAGGAVIAYNAPVPLPDGPAVRDRVFVRFARPATPPRRHAAGR